MKAELVIPDEIVERIAQRAAEIVLEQLGAHTANGGSESEFVTVAEAAAILRSRPQRVYDLLSDGRLTRFKDGSRVLIRRDELRAHLEGGVAHRLPSASRNGSRAGVAR